MNNMPSVLNNIANINNTLQPQQYNITSKRIKRRQLKRYQCKECGKIFVKKPDFVRHTRIHTHEKPFLCIHCRKRFCTKGNLKNHIDRIHLKLRPYQCPHCILKFAQPAERKKHIDRIHLRLKPHHCIHCKYSCATKGELRSHISHIHKKAVIIICQICGISCSNKSNMNRHIRNLHRNKKKNTKKTYSQDPHYNHPTHVLILTKLEHKEADNEKVQEKPSDNTELKIKSPSLQIPNKNKSPIERQIDMETDVKKSAIVVNVNNDNTNLHHRHLSMFINPEMHKSLLDQVTTPNHDTTPMDDDEEEYKYDNVNNNDDNKENSGFLGGVDLGKLFTTDNEYGKKYEIKIYSAPLGIILKSDGHGYNTQAIEITKYDSSGIKIGMILSNVNGINVLGLPFNIIKKHLMESRFPIKLSFMCEKTVMIRFDYVLSAASLIKHALNEGYNKTNIVKFLAHVNMSKLEVKSSIYLKNEYPLIDSDIEYNDIEIDEIIPEMMDINKQRSIFISWFGIIIISLIGAFFVLNYGLKFDILYYANIPAEDNIYLQSECPNNLTDISVNQLIQYSIDKQYINNDFEQPNFVDDLLNKKHPLKAGFPLHNNRELEYFRKEWISNSSPKLARVRKYFGGPIVFYFAFLVFYLKWLIAPAIIGLIFFIWQMSVSEVALDGIPFLCFFVIFWSVAFVDFWGRAEARYRLMWSMTKFQIKAVARPQFNREWQEEFSLFRRTCRVSAIYTFVSIWLLYCVVSFIHI